MTTNPDKKPSLNQQWEEENKQRKQQPIESPPIQKTPQQEVLETEAKIKAFKLKIDLESMEAGYKDLKQRESTFADREKALVDKQTELEQRIGKFELEQADRVAKVNTKSDEYSKEFNELKTVKTESKRIMEEAIRMKAEADNIIKSQTEIERINQEKQKAYVDNMDNSLELFSETIQTLRRQEDGQSLSLAVTLGKDLNLIQWIQYKKLSLSTLADIIAVDCDRIVEVCEYLQNTNRDYSSLLKYLLDGVEWLRSALKIERTIETNPQYPDVQPHAKSV